jgi:hypothetical protein
MSEAGRPAGDESEQPTGRPTPAGRRRGRLIIPGAVIAAIVIVFVFILLVSQCGTGDDGSIYGQPAGAAPASVLDVPHPPAAR